MADGTILINTKIDNRDLEKGLQESIEMLRSLEKEKQEIEKKRTPLVMQTDDLSKQLSKAREEIKKLKAEQLDVDRLLNTASGANLTTAQYQAAVGRRETIGADLAAKQRQLSSLKQEWDSVTSRLAEYDQELAQTNERLNAVSAAGGELARQLASIRVREGVREKAKALLETVKQLAVQAGNAAKSFLSLYFGGKQSGSPLLKSMKTMLLYSVGVEGLYSLFGKLRRAVADGMTSLAQFSDSVEGSLSEMRSALDQLKNSLAAAFAPILTVVEPILERFVDMVSSAAAAVARLTAMLTGQGSYIRAAKAQEKYAQSLAGTAAAAKEAQKQIMGFDEINKLGSQDTGGGGGSSGAFETVDIEPVTFDSWGQAFHAMLDSIVSSGIPKLKEAFSSFSAWLNGVTANLYEMFRFPGVAERITAVSTQLADAFNGLVMQINWETLGGSLGAGLDSALRFLVSFVWNFDWYALGTSIAEAFNSMIEELDWETVGLWFAAKFKIIVDSLAGLIQGMDMAQLAQAASTVITSFLDAMTETIAKTDWQAIGNQIGTFLANIDWAGIVSSITIGLTELLLGLGDFIWGSIEDYFGQFIQWAEDNGLHWVEGIVVGIIQGAVDLLAAVWELCGDVWETFCEYFGIHSPSTLMESGGSFLVAGLLNGISDSWGDLLGYLGGAMEDIESLCADTWEAVKQTAADIWQHGIVETIRNTVNEIISFINGLISGVVNGINTVAQVMNSMKFSVPEWVPGFGGASVGFDLPQITSFPQIPYLAQGAVIPPNREFLAVLGDQRHGTNIEAPADLIRQIVREEMQGRSGCEKNDELLQELIQVVMGIQVGDETIGRAAARYNRRASRAGGY